MSSLSMMESKLPPGFRFHPTDDELVCDYLAPKASGGGNRSFHGCQISDVDLNKVEPWDFPETACVGGPYVGSKKCYFFSLKDRKYATGQRTNRATRSGHWKATGKDRQVTRKGRLVGMRKTLVFYEGRAPKGKKTEWVMHEFRMEGQGDHSLTKFSFKEDWVLCRAFLKKGVISSKPSTETCYEDTVFSSLPPLLDNYMSFEQTPPKGLEQVPCFSNHQASQLPNSVVVQHLPPIDRSFSTKSLAHLVGLPEMGFFMNQALCDEKVIKAVVNHITHLDSNQEAPLNMAEGRPESYWTEAGLPSSRSPYYELLGIPSHVGGGVFQS